MAYCPGVIPNSAPLRYGIVLPACNEEESLGAVLEELQAVLDAGRFEVAVGVNGSVDRTAQIAREAGTLVGETAARGYGHGCLAAIRALEAERAPVDAFIFMAADGANDSRDIAALVAAHARADMVLGCRTRTAANWSGMNVHYVAANRIFGAWCGLLTGRFFDDLGPLRLIGRELFFAMDLCEWTYGWTIEAQIRAVRLGRRIEEVPVRERARLAGQQKVSHVSWRRTLSVGVQILAAGLRARLRPLRDGGE
jgi:glycosyltransferase involved in cell wall biosynthesis